MRIETLGEGDPEVAVVGGIHGDEPSGETIVERIEDRVADPNGTVQLVVANERALAAGVRYTEQDLNRSFPGAPGGTSAKRIGTSKNTRISSQVW